MLGRTVYQSWSVTAGTRGCGLNLNTLKKVVKERGGSVVIDDSIVRGTTSKKIVKILRMAGARRSICGWLTSGSISHLFRHCQLQQGSADQGFLRRVMKYTRNIGTDSPGIFKLMDSLLKA